MSQKNIGPKIKLEGYSTFAKQIRNCQAQLNLLAATMQKNATEFARASNKTDLYRKNIANLKAKQWEVAEQIRQNNALLEVAVKRYGSSSTQALEYETVIAGLKNEMFNLRNALAEQNIELAKSTIEWSKFGVISKITDKIQPAVSKIANGLWMVSKYASLAAVGLGAVFSVKAYNRIQIIDKASAKLEALGYNVSKVTDQVSESVMGTANKLEDAFNVAPAALAAGAEDAYGLETYLKRVGDLASFTGTSVTQMGTLMNKALSKGRVDARLLNQMLYNGIPIYTLLSEHMGVTVDELQSLVRKGKVSFDDLYASTERFDGMAQSLAEKTLPGLADIIQQRFTQIAQSFMEKPYELLKGDLKIFADWIKNNKERFKEWGYAFGDAVEYVHNIFTGNNGDMDALSEKARKIAEVIAPMAERLKKVVDWFKELDPAVKKTAAKFILLAGPVSKVLAFMLKIPGGLRNAMTGFTTIVPKISSFVEGANLGNTALGKFVTNLNGTLTASGGTFASGLLRIAGIIGLVVTAFVLMFKNSEAFRESIKKLASFIGQTFTTVISKLKPILGRIGDALSVVAEVCGDVLGVALNYVMEILEPFIPMLEAALDAVGFVVDAIGLLFDGLKGVWGLLKGEDNPFSDLKEDAAALSEEFTAGTESVHTWGTEMAASFEYARNYGKETTETATEVEEAWTSAASTGTASVNAIDDAIENTIVTYDQLDEATQNVVTSMQEAYGSLLESATSVFDAIETESEYGLADMIANLDNNATAVQAWGDNIKWLIENGVAPELVESLIQAGVDSAAEVQNIVNDLKADDGMVAELNESWENAANAAKSAFESAYGADALTDEIMNMVTLQESTLRESIASIQWDTLAQGITDGTAQGITDGTADVVNAVEGMSDATQKAYRSSNGINSPSTVYAEFGQYIMDGLKLGLNLGVSGVVKFFKNLSEKLKRSFDKASMYAEMYSVGSYAMQGFKDGITAKSREIVNTSQQIANSVATNMRTALNEQSPSKVTYEIGAFAGQGLVNGLLSMAMASRNAGNFLATSVMEGMGGLDIQRALDNTNKSMINASSTFEVPIDYDRLGSLLNQGIYIDSRLVGRTKLGKGMVIA